MGFQNSSMTGLQTKEPKRSSIRLVGSLLRLLSQVCPCVSYFFIHLRPPFEPLLKTNVSQGLIMNVWLFKDFLGKKTRDMWNRWDLLGKFEA